MGRYVLASLPLLLLTSLLLAGEEHAGGGHTAWWLVILFTLFGVVIWLFSRGRYLVLKDGQLRPAFTELQEFSSYLLAGTLTATYRFLERVGHIAGPIVISQLFLLGGQEAKLMLWVAGAITLFGLIFLIRTPTIELHGPERETA